MDFSPVLRFSSASSASCSSRSARISRSPRLARRWSISALFFAWQRIKRGRRIRCAHHRCARCFRGASCAHRSNQADIGYLFFNVFVFSMVFGWAVLSYQFISNGIISGLVGAVRPGRAVDLAALRHARGRHADAVPRLRARLLVQSLAQPQGAALWEFHKVHHTAEVLTPLTNFRVHPVYTWIFANILALSAAVANGLGHYMFGDTAYQYALADTNIILVLFIHAYVHLAALAHVDFVPRLARAACSFRRHIIRCITPAIRNTSTRISAVAWRCGTGCSARSIFRTRSASRSPLVSGSPDAHTVQGRTGRSADQRRRPSQAAVAAPARLAPHAGDERKPL